ncbi:MAG TPA: fibronectin type III domain-containing protein, partial [Candidatus Kapabacteria bacterium]|nr:fibronectin type III domain-containing protein [Candidatus Kapabacteria bacterium]
MQTYSTNGTLLDPPYNRYLSLRAFLFVLAIACSTMLLETTGAFAQQTVGAPQDVTAKWSTAVNATTNDTVNVQWQAPRDTGALVSFYVVYAASGQVQSTTGTQWRPVATVLAPSTSAMLSLSDLNITSPRTMSFYVRSVEISLTDTIRSEASNIAVAIWDSGGGTTTLRFTSEPVRVATVGKLYSYQAIAKSSDSTAVITYSLVKGPDSMMIDSATGLVTWT